MNRVLEIVASNYILLIVVGAFAIALAAYRLIGIARIAAAVARHPKSAILISLVVVGFLGIGIKNITMDADLKSILPKNISSQRANDKIEKDFGSVDQVFIVVRAKQGKVWNASILRKIAAMTSELEKMPYVDRIVSLSNGKDVRNVDDELVVGKMMDGVPSSQAGIDALRDRIKANPILGKRLVSTDDTVSVISVLLKLYIESGGGVSTGRKVKDEEVCAYDPGDLAKPTLENLKARYEDEDTAISFSGLPYIRFDMARKMAGDMSLFLPAGIAIMLAFLFLCFRSLRGMLLPFLVVVSSLIGLYGFIGWTGEKLYLPYVIIGPMFIAIAHNYGTQLIAEYYEELRSARSRPGSAFDGASIAKASIVKMSSPILLSAATVVIGFLTMLGHPLPAMAFLGYFSAFGIILAFALTIVLTPAILGLLPPARKALAQGQDERVDRALVRVSRFVMRRRGPILACAVALVAVCAFLIPRVKTDSNAIGFYKKSSEAYKTFTLMGEKFSGASTINVLLESEHPVAADSMEDGVMKSPAALKWMESFQAYAASMTDPKTGKHVVGNALSVADQVSYMNQAMKSDPSQFLIPEDGRLIAQYLLVADQDDLSSFADSKFNSAQIIVQLPDMGTKSVSAVVDGIKSYVRDNPPPGIAVSLGGSIMSVYEINRLLLEGQIRTILLSVGIIVLCYMLVFRSIAAGLLSSIPLVIAICIVFGLMAIFGINLDNITSILTGIMIGAGTDYTAYFLWRMRELAPVCANLEEVYTRTMETIGKGIVYNGFSVVIGFVVFFASNFLPVVFFGFLISASIFICIAAALTILPIAAIIAKPRFLLGSAKERL